MALQFRKGTAAERLSSAVVPASGEPLFTYDDGQLYMGDGVTVGGVNVGSSAELSDLSDVVTIENFVRTIQSFSITSNVASITLTQNHNYYAGLTVIISGSTTAILNGTYIISSILAANRFQISKTNANVAETNTNGAVSPRIATGEALIWNEASDHWENGYPTATLPFTSFRYTPGTKPAGGVAPSSVVGSGGLGTWRELTFANFAGNGNQGPSSAVFNPTLSGLAPDAGYYFDGFTKGKYLITAEVTIEIDKPSATIATKVTQGLVVLTGSTALYSSIGVGTILPYASYGSVASSFTNHFSLVVEMESSNVSINDVFIALNQNQSNEYWVARARINFVRIG